MGSSRGKDEDEEAPSKATTTKGDADMTDSYKKREYRDKEPRYKDSYYSKSNGERARHRSRRDEDEDDENEGGRGRGGRSGRHEEDGSRGKRSRANDDEGRGHGGGYHGDGSARGKRSRSYHGDDKDWGEGYGWDDDEGHGDGRGGRYGRYGSRVGGSRGGNYHQKGEGDEGVGHKRPPSALEIAAAAGERRRASEQAAQLQAKLAKGGKEPAGSDRKAAGNGTDAAAAAGKVGTRRADTDEGDLAGEDAGLEGEKLAGTADRAGGAKAAGRGRYRDEEDEMQMEEEADALGKRGGGAPAKGGAGGGRTGRYRGELEEEELGDAAGLEGRVRSSRDIPAKVGGVARRGMRYPQQEYLEEDMGGPLLDEELYPEDEEGYAEAAAALGGRRLVVPRRPGGSGGSSGLNFATLLKHSAAASGVMAGLGGGGMGGLKGPGVVARGAGAGLGAGLQGLTQAQMMAGLAPGMKLIDPHASMPNLGNEFVPVIAFAHRDLVKFHNQRLPNQPLILGRSGALLSAGGRGMGGAPRAGGLGSRLMAGGLEDAYEEAAAYEEEEDAEGALYGEGVDEPLGVGHGAWIARGAGEGGMRGAGRLGFPARAAAPLGGMGAGFEEGNDRWAGGRPAGGSGRLAGRLGPPVGGGAEEEDAYPHEEAHEEAHAPAEGGRGKAGAAKYAPRYGASGGAGTSHAGGKREDAGRHPSRDSKERKVIVHCPPDMVKHIIGRGGETIRSLQASSGAHIFVNQDFPPDKEREVRIAGLTDNVNLAEKMVVEIIDNGDNKGIQHVIQRVLGSGVRRHRGGHDSGRDYPEHYRMGSETSEPRSPEPDRHIRRSSEKGDRSQARWAHDKYSDDNGSDRSRGSTPPRKRRS